MTVSWLPVAVTGAQTSSDVWLPESTPSSPEVWSEVRSAAPHVAPDPSDEAWLPSPTPVSWLPETVTGTHTSTEVWFPDATPSSPEDSSASPTVTDSQASWDPPDAPWLPLPTTVTWLPSAVTGAHADTVVRLPDATPSSPEVPRSVEAGRGEGGAGAPAVVEWFWLSLPSTVTWLPTARRGASRSSSVRLPDPTPSDPFVEPASARPGSAVSAEAEVAVDTPRRTKPPAKIPLTTPRRSAAFMVSLLMVWVVSGRTAAGGIDETRVSQVRIPARTPGVRRHDCVPA